MFLLLPLFVSFIKSLVLTSFYLYPYYYHHHFLLLFTIVHITLPFIIIIYMLFLQPLFMPLFNLQSLSLLVFLVVHNIYIIFITNIFVPFTFIIIFMDYYLQVVYLQIFKKTLTLKYLISLISQQDQTRNFKFWKPFAEGLITYYL